MDRSLLWKLKEAVADFKPEREVFLAARTASSTAVAQLPAYKNFALSPMVRRVCFAPCGNTPTTQTIPSPKERTFTVR